MADAIDNITGGAQGKEGTTVSTFAISLSAGFVLFGVQFGAFLLVRNYLWARRIYQPRSFLIPLKDRVRPPPGNPIKWIARVFKTSIRTEILPKAGMDAYFFLRYLLMCLKIFLPLAILVLPILLPLNYVNGKGTSEFQYANSNQPIRFNVTGLDTLAWSNVAPVHTNRYWAHLILAIIVIAWTCYLFYQELSHYVATRQEYLSSPSHRLKASSTTVLITDIPSSMCSTEALTAMYDDFPGGLRRIWINRNYQKLVDKDEARKQVEDQLENAETNLIRKVVKQSRKQASIMRGEQDTSAIMIETRVADEPRSTRRKLSRGDAKKRTTKSDCQTDLQHDLDTKALWTRYVTAKQRQTMHIFNPARGWLCWIPLIGRFFCESVDTIYYCRRELARMNEEIDRDVEQAETCPPNGSAFIQFNSQKAAHLACQAVADVTPQHMTQRTVEISPADINWPSLNYSWKVRAFRHLVFLTLFAVVIVVFGLISFFTGILSKASTLAGSTSWLAWISKLPRWLLSFIQGTLPPVIQVIVLSGPTPIVLRAMTNKTKGATTGSQGERSLQLWYFIFLLLELLIIPTISSGLTTIVNELIHQPGSIPNLLATDLPTASNYYFSFLILQALSISASSILQTIRLFNFYVLGGANTPDRVFQKLSWTNLTRIGSNIPWYTTFAVIGLVYSVIAPLIIIFMLITFGLFYIVIKNNMLYVVRAGNVDSGGLWIPSAINQTFTGLYLMEICLTGLFFLVRNQYDNVACDAQGIIMAVCLVLTMLYHIWLMSNFGPLFRFAPLRLEEEALQRDRDYELQRLTAPTRDEKVTGKTTEEEDSSTIPARSSHKHLSDEELEVPDTHLKLEPTRSSHRSTAIADRSKEMADRKAEDQRRGQKILARINRPLDEHRLAALETHLAKAEARVGNILIPRTRDIEAQMMNDPISKIIMQHNDELEDLDPEERDMLISIAFTHPILREAKPSVWIPKDDLGVSDDEVRRTRELSEQVVIDNRGAYFNKKMKVKVDKPPPDMSEFALVMAEL